MQRFTILGTLLQDSIESMTKQAHDLLPHMLALHEQKHVPNITQTRKFNPI